MKNFLSNPGVAALCAFLLSFPMAFIFTFVLLDIELPLGPFEPILVPPVGEPAVTGSLVVLTLFLLLLPAFYIASRPVLSSLRENEGLIAHPVNLILSVYILVLIFAIIGSIVIDQYPCWIGMPNCD